jgi:N-acetylated-alpha-linked acidic dipeptidase
MPLSHSVRLLAGLAFLFAGAGGAADTPATMTGFSTEHASAERRIEASFDAGLRSQDLDAWMKTLSSAPNQVGSPHDKANAEWVAAQMRSFGWDARIETFDVLYPTLKSHALELVAPHHFSARLAEAVIPEDSTSGKQAGSVPPFHAYGGDGDVTAELVYVNYGMPEDYKQLDRLNISVQGKIVIARYGHGWRGLKPKLAHEHGALGCIIYSDPADDGYGTGDAYPKGGTRPSDGVQRGSVADMPLYPGDPLTPGVGAVPGAPRLALKDAATLMKIPVLPISYGDAQPLLAALAGPLAPRGWRGALPLTYHVGSGPARVHLAVKSNWNTATLYDVIATITGSEAPDEWVVRGNHRDGWVFGAWDPLSGHVAMLAEAQAIGALFKSGWRPKRTLVYASWDGEEPGLLGSTEWVETHGEELAKKAVLYLNSDTNSRGFLSTAGSDGLTHFVNEAAGEIVDPETSVSVAARVRARARAQAFDHADGEDRAEVESKAKIAAAGGDLPLEPLGSGSDFTPFLQHAGIATLSIEYNGEDEQAGSYHSVYDSYDHYRRFGDPGFAYGVVEAKTVGRIVLRMADADVLPYRFAGTADAVGHYLEDLKKELATRRERAETLATLLSARVFEAAADPQRPTAPPAALAAVPYVNFAPLDNALARLKRSAQAFDAAAAAVDAGRHGLTGAQRKDLDQVLGGMESTLLTAKGLPGRPWYRHTLYAPGLLTGYGVKTLPGAREAIEGDRYDEASEYAALTAQAIEAYAARIESAVAILTR